MGYKSIIRADRSYYFSGNGRLTATGRIRGGCLGMALHPCGCEYHDYVKGSVLLSRASSPAVVPTHKIWLYDFLGCWVSDVGVRELDLGLLGVIP